MCITFYTHARFNISFNTFFNFFHIIFVCFSGYLILACLRTYLSTSSFILFFHVFLSQRKKCRYIFIGNLFVLVLSRPYYALNRWLTLVGLERKDSSKSRIDEKEKIKWYGNVWTMQLNVMLPESRINTRAKLYK